MKKKIAPFAEFEGKTALETLAILRSRSVQCISGPGRCILQFAQAHHAALSPKTPWIHPLASFGIIEAKP